MSCKAASDDEVPKVIEVKTNVPVVGYGIASPHDDIDAIK